MVEAVFNLLEFSQLDTWTLISRSCVACPVSKVQRRLKHVGLLIEERRHVSIEGVKEL